MRPKLSIAPLASERVLQAYPLIREATPDVTVEGWRRFALAAIGGPRTRLAASGAMVVRTENDYLRGVFTYHVGPDMHRGRILVVDSIVVSSLFMPEAVADAILEAIDALAKTHDCRTIQTDLLSRTAWLQAHFEEHGYGRIGNRLGRQIA